MRRGELSLPTAGWAGNAGSRASGFVTMTADGEWVDDPLSRSSGTVSIQSRAAVFAMSAWTLNSRCP